MEKHLEQREAEVGLPTFYRSKPLVERMVGFDQAAIDQVQTWLDAIPKIVTGRQDELPEHVKRELATDADAELSGAEQLAAIMGLNRKTPS
jgi:hypothetical protein